MKFEFKNHNKDWIKRFDEYQLSVIQGDKGDIIERTNYDECEMVYDTQTDNIVMKPYKHIIIKGSYDITQRWDRGCNTSITRRDVERYRELMANEKMNSSPSFYENTTDEAVENKQTFNKIKMELTNDVISPVSGQYIIVCDHECEATEDDTRLVCVQAPVAYSSQILLLDIPAGETRTVAKQKDITYLFFSENCSISGTSIKQYDVKRLTSESVDIKNESEDICRIIILQR